MVSSAFGVLAPGAERLLSFGLRLSALTLPVRFLFVPSHSLNILVGPEAEHLSPYFERLWGFDPGGALRRGAESSTGVKSIKPHTLKYLKNERRTHKRCAIVRE